MRESPNLVYYSHENNNTPSEFISTHCGVCQSDDGKGTEDRDGAFMSY